MKIKINTEDLIGELTNFPIEIIEKMLEYQYKQNNIIDISVFINFPRAEKYQNGFNWKETPEGFNFWDSVIREKRFDVFFKRYAKSKEIYIRGDVNNGEEIIKELKSRGGINKYDYSGNANNMLYFIDPVTNYIVGATKTEEAFQNLLKSYYTEISLCGTKIVELTVEEIAEKFGIDSKQLRIKK